jgi:hypothetical protein
MLAWLEGAAAPKVTMALGAALLVVSMVLVVRSIRSNPYWLTTTDFGEYFHGAALIREEHNPYDPSYYAGIPLSGHYLYPLALAEVLIALAAVAGPWGAGWLWVALSAFSLGASLIILLRRLWDRQQAVAWPWVLLVIGLFSCTFFVHNDLYYGSSNAVLLLMLVGGLYALSRAHRSCRTSIWVDVHDQAPVCGARGVAVVAVVAKALRAAGATLVCAFILGFGSFLVAGGPEHALGWVRDYLTVISTLVVVYSNNLALHGLVLRLFTSTPSTVPWLLAPWVVPVVDMAATVWLTVVCVRALTWNRDRPVLPGGMASDPSRLLLESGLVLAIGMTLGPLTEGDHLVLLIPGFVAVVGIVLRTCQAPPSVRIAWNWAAISWTLVMAAEFSPVPYRHLAGINITQLVGVRPTGLIAV